MTKRLCRELVREFWERRERVAQRIQHAGLPKKRGPWFRQVTHDIEHTLGDALLGVEEVNSGKHAERHYFSLEPDTRLPGRLRLIAHQVFAKDYEVKSAPSNIVFTRHAIERAFQRLKTPNTVEMCALLRAATQYMLSIMEKHNGKLKPGELQIVTPRGIFLGKVTEEETVFQTFVDIDKLSPHQLAQMEED